MRLVTEQIARLLLSAAALAMECLAAVSNMEDSCFPAVGCFSNKEPWISISRSALPPQHPANVSKEMYLYSSSDPNGATISLFPEINLNNISIDNTQPTFVLLHGFGGSSNSSWLGDVRDSLRRRTGGNVIIASWAITNISYEQAVSDARVAAKLIVQGLNSTSLDLSKIHFIGHCVGSQVASYAAKLIKEMGMKVSRVTALNPAGPLFENQPMEVRLNEDDAELVDVVHTDIMFKGVAWPVGDVDFYFNGAVKQPGCSDSDPKGCSHDFAHRFFEEAMQDDCMMGQPAELVINDGQVEGVRMRVAAAGDSDAPVLVGLNTPPSARGIYAVLTNPSSPYCIPLQQ